MASYSSASSTRPYCWTSIRFNVHGADNRVEQFATLYRRLGTTCTSAGFDPGPLSLLFAPPGHYECMTTSSQAMLERVHLGSHVHGRFAVRLTAQKVDHIRGPAKQWCISSRGTGRRTFAPDPFPQYLIADLLIASVLRPPLAVPQRYG